MVAKKPALKGTGFIKHTRRDCSDDAETVDFQAPVGVAFEIQVKSTCRTRAVKQHLMATVYVTEINGKS